MLTSLRITILTGSLLLSAGICCAEAVIIDHRHTDISRLSESQINRAKSVLHIAYGHTSHGSQLTDGMSGLVAFANGAAKDWHYPAISLNGIMAEAREHWTCMIMPWMETSAMGGKHHKLPQRQCQ